MKFLKLKCLQWTLKTCSLIFVCVIMAGCFSSNPTTYLNGSRRFESAGLNYYDKLTLYLNDADSKGRLTLYEAEGLDDNDGIGDVLMDVIFTRILEVKGNTIVLESELNKDYVNPEALKMIEDLDKKVVIEIDPDNKMIFMSLNNVLPMYSGLYSDLNIPFQCVNSQDGMKEFITTARKRITNNNINYNNWVEPTRYLGEWANIMDFLFYVYAAVLFICTLAIRNGKLLILHILMCVIIYLTLHWSWMPGFALLPVFFVFYPFHFLPKVETELINSICIFVLLGMLILGLYLSWSDDGFWTTVGHAIVWFFVGMAGYAIMSEMTEKLKCPKCGYFISDYGCYHATERYKNIRQHFSVPLNRDGSENKSMDHGNIKIDNSASPACYHCKNGVKNEQ